MNQIKISSDVQQLTGQGEEWLVAKDGETVIAKFFDGNMVHPTAQIVSSEPTLIAA